MMSDGVPSNDAAPGFRYRCQLCYTEKAEQAQQHLGNQATINPAEDNRKQQCKPNEPKPNFNVIYPRTRHNKLTRRYTPRRVKEVNFPFV